MTICHKFSHMPIFLSILLCYAAVFINFTYYGIVIQFFYCIDTSGECSIRVGWLFSDSYSSLKVMFLYLT